MKKNPIKTSALCGLALAGLLSAATWAQGWFGSDAPPPSLTLAPAEIALNIPTPVQGGNLELLLARAGDGGFDGLSELKAQASRRYRELLQRELDAKLSEHFAGEEVPLVREKGFFTLHSFFDIKVGRQLIDLKTAGDYEIEHGTLELAGDFHYRLENASGAAVRDRRLDIAGLRLREKYRVKTPTGGGEAEDSTDEAIERALSRLAAGVLERIGDELEADELRELAAL